MPQPPQIASSLTPLRLLMDITLDAAAITQAVKELAERQAAVLLPSGEATAGRVSYDIDTDARGNTTIVRAVVTVETPLPPDFMQTLYRAAPGAPAPSTATPEPTGERP